MSDHEAKASGESAPPFTELVYAGREARDWFAERWPTSTLKDASDFVHDERFEVTIPALTDDQAYPVIIAGGWALVCLGLGLHLRMPESKSKVERWITDAEALIAESQASLAGSRVPDA